MRVIHLGFVLHSPLAEDEFRARREKVFLPLLALLERNMQKHDEFRVSLLVSGMFLEAAERYDAELVRRVRALVNRGRAEIVALPYYYSLAEFYSELEGEAQIELLMERVKRALDTKPRFLAQTELCYNDVLAHRAERAGFAGMLAAGGASALGWRSAGHVYEAKGCEYLRVLFGNLKLANLVARGDKSLLVEKKVTKDGNEPEMRTVLSSVKFVKLLELECLRGGLVNLYFDAEVLNARYDLGVISFFDELIGAWLGTAHGKFAKASEASVAETPTAEVTVPCTVSWREEKAKAADVPGAVLLKKDAECVAPTWVKGDLAKAEQELYALRAQVVSTEDEGLIREFRELTALGVAESLPYEEMSKRLESLQGRAEQIKKTQAVEISRKLTRKPELDDNGVRVSVGKPAAGGVGVKVNDGAAFAVKVQRVAKPKTAPVDGGLGMADEPETVDELEDADELDAADDLEALVNEVVDDADVDVAEDEMLDTVEEVDVPGDLPAEESAEVPVKMPKKGIKRIIRKLVIE